MDKKRGKVAESRSGRGSKRADTPPPAARTRSKSPARVQSSGRDSAPIKKVGKRTKKPDTPSEESSSQSSTPKKNQKKSKTSQVHNLDDSGDNEEVADINAKYSLRKRKTPVSYKNTPTPHEERRSISRSVSRLTAKESDEETEKPDKCFIFSWSCSRLRSLFCSPVFALVYLIFFPIILRICFNDTFTLARLLVTLAKKEYFFNATIGWIYLSFLIGTALFSLIPLRVVKLPGSNEDIYKFNGILVAAVTLVAIIGFEFQGVRVWEATLANIDQLLFLSIIASLFMSVILYIKARRYGVDVENPECNGKIFDDFARGLDISPTFGDHFNIKSVIYVRSAILILVINIALIYKNVSIPAVTIASGLPIGELIKETFFNLVFIVNNAQYNPTSLVISGLLAFYASDSLFFEHHRAVSYDVNSSGCGAIYILRHATYPFLLSFLPRFVLDENVRVHPALLGVISVVFLFGWVLKRCSNSLRYHYRINPKAPKYKSE